MSHGRLRSAIVGVSDPIKISTLSVDPGSEVAKTGRLEGEDRYSESRRHN